MFEKIKMWVVQQVLWAEKNLPDKTGAEKRGAVIAKLDELIQLPFYLEWLDDKLIGILVDLCCDKLNQIYAHKFADAKPDIAKLAHEIALPEEITHESEGN